MTYNSFLILKGVKKQILLSKDNAEKVRKILEDENIAFDTWINMAGTGFRKSEIKYIEINPDGSTSDSNEKNREAFYEEEKKNRTNLAKQSAEYKAGLLDMFTYLYKFSTGDFPSEEKLGEAQSIQHRFFIAKPSRTLCDAHLLKTVIPIVRSKKINPYELGYFRMVENAIARDMQLAD